MKIAIIGGGVSGLTSAYLLAPLHEVTLYEKDSRIGGHAHTVIVEEDNKKIPVDNGFMVFNPERYPNFVKLLEALDVKSIETTMSFGVSLPGEVAYRGNFPNGLFAIRKNIFNIRFLRFVFGILRFQKIAKKSLQNQSLGDATLQSFLSEMNISKDVSNWFLYPMLAAIWSIKDSEKVADFPALATLTFLNNHKLLDSIHPKWRTIEGGSVQYVSKIKTFLEENDAEIKLNAEITEIRRTEKEVSIKTKEGIARYDYVLFATHANVAARLLIDISKEEKEALEKFTYTKNTTVLHKDANQVPENKRLLAAWNYGQTKDANKKQAVFTYCMNILQHIPMTTPVLVTLNPLRNIPKEKVYATEIYEHPQYHLNALKGQRLIEALQGTKRTLYAGAHLGYGFHEDGVASAIRAIKTIGVSPPWQA
jgi:predicted NAD/FAD-binding protein